MSLLLPVVIFFVPARTAIRVLHNPAVAEGTVTELMPHAHRTVAISYEIEGRMYRSSTSLTESMGLPRFDDIRPGDRVRIVYNPQYPGDGIPGAPKKLLFATAEDFALVAIGLLIFSILLELRLRKWLLQRR
jgi:hypothetical protein